MLKKHFGCARWVYNWGLAKRIELWEKEKKSVSGMRLKAQLPAMKQAEETKWLSEVNAQSLQAAMRNLDSAYTRFFREKKGFPKFKSRRGRQSFQCPQRVVVDFEQRRLSIPKIAGLKFRDDRHFEGDIKTVTISRTPTGKYFASILVDNGKAEPKPKKRIREQDVVGIDLGIKHFLTLSTGDKIENPRQLKWSMRKLRRVQRQLSRKKKGSSNREKCRQKVALVHERVANQRRDFHHKLSTRLIRENQAIAIENLNVIGMQQNTRLAQAISDAGWAQFIGMLEYKAHWTGKTILRIGRFEPSSKLCSCGVINQTLTLSQRTWKCSNCGVEHDRDLLAANNIKRMALHPQNFLTAGSREIKPVENGKSRSVKQECFSAN